MRWLILVPAGPGALIGGWLGQHAGLRASLDFAGYGGLLLAFVAWRSPLLRDIKSLPKQESGLRPEPGAQPASALGPDRQEAAPPGPA